MVLILSQSLCKIFNLTFVYFQNIFFIVLNVYFNSDVTKIQTPYVIVNNNNNKPKINLDLTLKEKIDFCTLFKEL